MAEFLKGKLERISLPVEQKVWGVFDGYLQKKNHAPKWTVLVGDDGKGTLPALVLESYPDSKVITVDNSPAVVKKLETNKQWIAFTNDVTNREWIEFIQTNTGGGPDVVFFKHGLHLGGVSEQEELLHALFRLCRPDGYVGMSVPTLARGFLTSHLGFFVDKTIGSGILGSTVFVGKNNPARNTAA